MNIRYFQIIILLIVIIFQSLTFAYQPDSHTQIPDTNTSADSFNETSANYQKLFKDGYYTIIISPEIIEEKGYLSSQAENLTRSAHMYNLRDSIGCRTLAENALLIGYDNSINSNYRSLIKYDLSGIPDNYQIYEQNYYALDLSLITIYSPNFYTGVRIKYYTSSMVNFMNKTLSVLWNDIASSGWELCTHYYFQNQQTQPCQLFLKDAIQNCLSIDQLVIGLHELNSSGYMQFSTPPNLEIVFGPRMTSSGEIPNDETWSFPTDLPSEK